MPSPSDDKPISKICIRIWTEDLDFLREMAAANSDLGYNFIMRQIIHNYVVQMKDRERKHIDQIPKQEVEEPIR